MERIILHQLKVNEEKRFYEVIGSTCIYKNDIQSFRAYHSEFNMNLVHIEDFFELEKEGILKEGDYPTEITLKTGKKVFVVETTDYIKKICDSFITLTLDMQMRDTTECNIAMWIEVNPAHIVAVTKSIRKGYLIISTTSSEELYVNDIWTQK